MARVIIIGAGPAGISAALYTIRAGIPTTVFSSGDTALNKADKIENYYGFAEPISGSSLYQSGIEGARRLGVEFIQEQVVGIGLEDRFVVETTRNRYTADSVIIATGSQRPLPNIPNIRKFEGKGVSYCAVCDAFFYRQKPVAVIGSGEYALHEASELLHTCSSVTLFTNGSPLTASFPDTVRIIETPIAEIYGEEKVGGVRLTAGAEIPVAGVFVAIGTAAATDFARKLGVEISGNSIVVDEKMRTNVPGLFAAGDCIGGVLQVSVAVGEGAKAALSAIEFVRKKAKS
ncbi:MAG TPA: FAD-dependent oxidoreductase [Bacillota bacterium]|nr:FAD-dependent oxidoreductase [Bacillota bacterium]